MNHSYDTTDGRLIRTITGATPEYSLANFAAVLNETRDFSENASYVIHDSVYDAQGRLERSHDGRNVAMKYEYDETGRRIATISDADYPDRGTLSTLPAALALRTETDYNAVGNTLEVRSPRYFDAGDAEGHNKSKETWTYTDRGLVATHTVAAGSTEEATESFIYDLKGRRTERTDFANKVWKTHYEDCCGQVTATENPLGHGSISRTNAVGQTIHQVTVADYSDHVAALDNPVDAKTLREVTTRYDGRGRPIARTTWVVARGVVDQNNPPIAGLDGVAAADGLTTQYLYDDDLTDGAGLDSAAGATPALGGNPISLADAITKLADSEANGGAGISFNADAKGTARAMVSPVGEIRFSVSAGSGSISGVLNPTDNSLITWSCRGKSTTTNLAGYGTVLINKSINAAGHITKSYTDAAGRTLESHDALGKITKYEYDAGGNRLSVRDPNNVGQDCIYDALRRDLSCTIQQM